MPRIPKRALVIGLCALVLSTVGIQASDVLQNVSGGLAGNVIDSGSVCGAGAVQVNLGSGSLCVDRFEAVPGSECEAATPASPAETAANVASAACVAQSVVEREPWTYVSQQQAAQLCARSGKRLPTAAEWHNVALALADQSSCVVAAGRPAATGSAGCETAFGVHDLVGNVWEWVDGEVVDGAINDRSLPERGYVSGVDTSGVVLRTTSTPQAEFGNDYAITAANGTYGIIRGGYFDSGDDAGLYAQNVAIPLDLKTEGIGFRCVRSL